MPDVAAEDLEETVRRADPDRWLASRFVADPQARADVVALYAFDHVLARVPAIVSEPLMGEIRLTWWSEALDEIQGGGPVRSHPVSLALAEAVRRRGLDRAPLDAMVQARMGDLDACPFADEAEALAYADQTAGALMQAAAQALGAPAGLEAARLAGRAYGLSLMTHRRAIGAPTRLPDNLTPRRAGALVAEALHGARGGLGAVPVPAFPAVAYACLGRRYAKGAHLTALEKQLRLVWATARGSL
ncbi:MAG: phytoene synthase [Caulobacteraceae bacterium]|nr:phytoene synthase [Caulobacteraceae bacterium]